MRATRWTRVLAAAVISGACLAPAAASAQVRERIPPGQAKKANDDYYRGYQQGLREGENDARRNRPYNNDSIFRNTGRRSDDVDFRNGYADGYRDGFNQNRDVRNERRDGIFLPRDERREGGIFQRTPSGAQEPAFARGYSDGYQDGANDGRDRKRYDPVGERDYRSADKGYYGNYGSKDAYRNNYRAGFRQGYEDGYREGGNRRR